MLFLPFNGNLLVSIGSLEHILPIIIAFIFAVILIRYSKKRLNKQQQHTVLRVLGAVVSLTVIVFHVHKIVIGNYNFNTDLPLFLCTFMALTIPFFTETRSNFLYEVLVFWIIGGTLQAVVTPDIPNGFPSIDFFRYWIVHLGLLIIIFYATFVLNKRPTFKSVFKSFFTLQVFFVFSLIINYLLGANYSYLNRKPNVSSVLDYLGEWPYYILIVEAFLIPYFLLIYLPFYLTRNKSN